MKKRYHSPVGLLILLIIAVFSRGGYCQSSDGGQDKADKASYSLPTNTGKAGANIVIGGIPVNLYTGAVNPSIPLYNLPSRGLSASISLSYTAGNGIQVLSQASEIGTGWQLNAGGEITCEVRGAPDEASQTDKEWLLRLANRDNDLRFLQNKIFADEDIQYDIYHANCAGLQVNFVIRGPYNGTSYEVYVLNNRTVTVSPQFASWGNKKAIISFTITDADGTKYVFDESAKTTIHSATTDNRNAQAWPDTDVTYTASWRLTRIFSISGDNIYFGYNVSSATPVKYQTTLSRGWGKRCDYYGGNCAIEAPRTDRNHGPTPPTFFTTVTVSQSYKHDLALISTAAGSITFVRGKHARLDKPGEYALSEIIIKNLASQVIKRYTFDYSYFGLSSGSDPDYLRLKLTQVKELAAGCVAVTTQFAYHETTFPGRNALRDYWGYFTKDFGRPREPVDPRLPDANSMRNCLLRRISSSMGSATELEYEPHLDKSGVQVGGVRLKKVTVQDGFNTTPDQVFALDYTVFDRNNPSVAGGPSSEAVTPPTYVDLQQVIRQGHVCLANTGMFYTYRFESTDPLESIAPDYVGYKWVSIKFPNASRSVYKFTNQADFPDNYNTYSVKLATNAFDTDAPGHDQQVGLGKKYESGCYNYLSEYKRGNYPDLPQTERPYGVLNNASHRRGLLLEQFELDSENRIVNAVENTYDFSQRDVVLRSSVIAKEQQVFAYSIYNFFYNIKFSDIEREWVPLQKQLVTSYDQRRNNSSSIQQRQQLTEFGYVNYMLATTQVSNPSGGEQYLTRITRVADYTPNLYTPSWNITFPPGIGNLYYSHSLATVTSVEQYVKPEPTSSWTLITTAEKEYFVRNNVPLLKRTVNTDFIAGGTQATGRSSVQDVEYDDKNNLVNTLSNENIWTGIVWGYNSLLPIASVVNGRIGVLTDGTVGLATAGHTSLEGAEDDNWWFAGSYYAKEAKTGVQSGLLSAQNNVYGPTKKFSLPPEAQHGKYNFSFWAKVPQNESGSSQVNMVTEVATANGQRFWSGPIVTITSNQEWKLCRVVLNLDEPTIQAVLTSGQNLTVTCYPWVSSGTGNVLVDELRFHPLTAKMTTTTYQPFIGKTSVTDANQATTYYFYDTNNDLRLIKDARGNIVKRLRSHAATPTDFSVAVAKTGGALYPGSVASFTTTVAECADGLTYTWNFGDGTSQKGGAQQDHTYAQTGTYQVTVVAEADDMNPVEATLTVTVTGALDVLAEYTGQTYYDLCESGGFDERRASITALPSGGCGQYTYRWEQREYRSWYGTWGDWTAAGNTSDTYPYYHSGARQLEVRCTVTDACGNTIELVDGFYTFSSNPRCAVEIELQSPQTESK